MYDPKAVAIVGLGAILPDAPNARRFWENVLAARYSIREVPPQRWRSDLYYDPDPKVPDKTYSKIGAWVQDFEFTPLQWGIPIPPSVLAVMDESQQWGIAAARQALLDYGYPQRSLDPSRVAVILGNALGGENHYRTSLRIHLPDFLDTLGNLDVFRSLPASVQQALQQQMQAQFARDIPPITEDTMPGELGNVIAGRIANVFNFYGPNFVTDAACASSLAALQAAVDGLVTHAFDAVLTGGVDRNMSVEGFVKFSKIGALSPDGSRPFAEGANGFVMGEGAAIFLLKRLVDAERDGDRIYAVIRGIGSSSDGKGKGITAPNPAGQQRAVERAWKNAAVSPASVGLIEAHGTSTRVGDVTEVASLQAVFGGLGLPVHSVAMGSVKSNIGHLKSAAGAAGLLKAVYALAERTLPPSANFHKPNPQIDFEHLPFYVNTEAQPWQNAPGEIRRAGVSAFGFGGTNFHVVLEEWVPGLLTQPQASFPGVSLPARETQPAQVQEQMAQRPLNGLLFLGASTVAELKDALSAALQLARQGQLPERMLPSAEALAQPQRLAIDFEDGKELIARAEKALRALESGNEVAWPALTAQGIQRGSGTPGKLAFLFPGQGSQYVNMLKDLCEAEPLVAETFREADEIMTPIFGRSLTSYIYVDGDPEALKAAEAALRDTTITQPAMLTANVALLRLMEKYGYRPDMVIGHSLGEYAALVAAGVLQFHEALEIVSARAQEMKKVSVGDPGGMVAVSAPLAEVERILQSIPEYVVIANVNSPLQCVVGGSTPGLRAALQAFEAAGYQATQIPVSHAFHTQIVASASEPLKQVIGRMSLTQPRIPVIANVTGEVYPSERMAMLELLGQQVASPVQFVKGIETMYALGARVFVEIGPKRVLNALATDILKGREVRLLATNHPRKGAVASFNEALCGLLAAGVGRQAMPQGGDSLPVEVSAPAGTVQAKPTTTAVEAATVAQPVPVAPMGQGVRGSVVISGAALGLPGRERQVFSDDNIERLLNGEMLIEPLPEASRQAILDRRITRLEKSEAGAQWLPIEGLDQTIQLAGQRGYFDPGQEFGFPEERMDACDITTLLAMAAGIDALRDAGIPLVMAYRQTSRGTLLPDRWKLPEALADETGVIFASAFPGLNRMAEEADRYYAFRQVEAQIAELQALLSTLPEAAHPALRARLEVLQAQRAEMDYHLDRRFVFRILSMGHAQFAEQIGARGPNTAVNAACATTTQAIALAEDWVRSGRCRRVVVIAADDVNSGPLAPWVGGGLLASGATTTEAELRKAVLPFDRRRNGMVMGMGAAALVVEAQDALRERGMTGICEILASQIANSAFHATRLDVQHVSEVMERLLQQAEARFGVRPEQVAAKGVFISHETYTPARGGSAAAEIHALRHTFGEHAHEIIVANTKGFTGHAMAVGIEDVLAVKALQLGRVPPIAHYDDAFEPDPELGNLNLSRGGPAALRYALRLGAGFGSQIAMLLLRAIPGQPQRVVPEVYQRWLADVSGYEQATLEVVQHTLRVRHDGPPVRTPARSTWQFGQGPCWFAPVPQDEPEQVAPAASVEQTTSTSATFEEIRQFVLAQVSEKTGYAADMLDPDLDLEADLGIDTVKQAELFATIRQHYNIPRREDLRLADYNTLRKVMAFVQDGLGNLAQVDQPAEAVAETFVPAVTVQEPTPVVAAQAPAAFAMAAVAVEEPTAAATVQEAASPVAAQGAVDRDAICQKVLAVVSQKTGYPPEMLDMGLDLEADLGIDTVKQAEMFAEVRTYYGIPRREDLRLADYNTLARVVDFVEEMLAKAAEQPKPTAEEQHAPEQKAQAHRTVRRRVPVPVLRGRLDLYLPTDVVLDAETVVWIISDQGKVAASLARRLRARSVKVTLLSPEQVGHHLEQPSLTPPHGVYDLTALKAEPNWAEMDDAAWQAALEQRTLPLYHLSRAFPQLRFVVAATRLGGLHGYGAEGATDALGGVVSGLVKALGRERPGCFVKVVDFGEDLPDAQIAARLLEETLNDAGAVEVGWRGEQRFGVATLEQALSQELFDLGDKPVFLVSGGSGGITVPILRDLARRTQGCFYLLGRTALPEDLEDVEWLRRDRNGLRTALIERMGKPTPVQVEQALAGLERAAAVLDLVKEIEQLGGRAVYRVCDVQQAESVRKVVTEIVAAEGRVDVLLHAAGVERSRKIESKPLEEFVATLAIKATGLFNLYKALRAASSMPRAMVLFGSVAGRFGNAGQTDYSAANDLLARMALHFRNTAPHMKVVTLDWGAWGEVGMASRGSLPKLMQRAGVELLSPQEAAPLVYQELVHGVQSGEVVLAGALGLLEEAGRKLEGGLDLEKANRALTEGNPKHIMFSRLTHYDAEQFIWLEAELDPNGQAFLKDHAMNGTPLLPGVMGIEGFSVAAQHIASALGSSGKQLQVVGLEDIQFLAPLKFYRNEARRITWKAQIRAEAEGLTAYVTLESTQSRWQGQAEVQTHFSGKVHLALDASEPLQLAHAPHWNGDYTLGSEQVYRLYFHGPAFQVLEAVQRSGEGLLGRLNPALPPLTDETNLLTNPLLLELCLQTAGLWQAGATGVLALPSAIGRLSLYPVRAAKGTPVYAEVYPRHDAQGRLFFDARVLDEGGQVYLELCDYRTAELPEAIDPALRSLLQPLVSAN